MTLEQLVVEIKGDNSDIKKKIADLKTQLGQASDKVRDLRNQLSNWDSIGVEQTSLAYKDLVKQLEQAENAQEDVNKKLEQYEALASDSANATNDYSDSLGGVKGKTELFGYSIGTIAKRMFGFYAILNTTKKAIQGFIEDNPNSGLAQFANELKDVGTKMRDFLITPFNSLLELSYGKASSVKVELKEVNVEIRDLTNYYRLLNKEVQRNTFLMGGFDELNTVAKKKEDKENQEAINELTEKYLELKEKQSEKQQEINKIWQDYSGELNLSVEQYKELYRLWAGGETEKAKDLAGELGLNWKTAENNLTNFANNGVPAIQALTKEFNDLGDTIKRVQDLINKLGGNSDNLPGGRRKVTLEEPEERNNGNPSTWAGKVQEEVYTPDLPIGYTATMFNTPGVYATGNTNPIGNQAVLDMFARYNGQDKTAEVIAQATSQVVTAIANQNLEVSIGDDVIAQSAARGERAYYQMTGGHLR